ncbi:MFS transporter [Actinophytocola oryzae]|uniref:Transmembrane secretion effector n=1 Tax=Actinophytocola oryzae TaxID=502181 RepID=A0A4R7V992_9PSEU|nr:MFS transporter [Actinophytocola oryzae]TDV45488.1 transmembrane secretion effector [Actinophytocola oryzae]
MARVTFWHVNRDFHLLFAAAAVSRLGTSVGYVATPLIAVTALDATPGEVGLLATLSTVAFLLIGLPAGAWTDRVRRRGVMVTADVGRAVVLCSVPVAWWFGVLHMAQLYVVVLLCGIGTVFFDVANQSYVPQVVGRSALLAANTRLVSVDAVNDIAGRGVAGYLVALVTAPVAVLVDAASFLVSAWCVLRVRHREPVPAPSATRLWPDMTEGISFVWHHRVLRTIATSGALANLGFVLVVTMLPVVLVDEMKVSPAVLGLFLASGGIGTLAGSLLARRLAALVGAGRLSLIGSLVAAPCGFGMPFVAEGPRLWLAGAGWVVVTAMSGSNNVVLVSFRQTVTPDRLLGRMTASFRFVLMGALALGAAAAGVIGEVASPRAAVAAGATAIALVWVPIMFSPLRKARELTGPEPAAVAA